MSGYSSESEDQPREVVNLFGDFTLVNSNPPTTLELRQLKRTTQQLPGDFIILPIRPAPDPRSVIHAKNAMGSGHDGVWTGTAFEAPDETSPDFMFPARPINDGRLSRFCIRRRFTPHISDLKTMAIYTDGACASNGRDAPRGGFAFVFNDTPLGVEARALENKGPAGEVRAHTNNRAELRAVVASLRFRVWWGEGWKRIVVITDSEYVGKGATTWLRGWARNGWRTSAGRPTANRDLWEALSEAMGTYAEGGCEISFWVVPRRWNTQADGAARAACNLQGEDDYVNHDGVLV